MKPEDCYLSAWVAGPPVASTFLIAMASGGKMPRKGYVIGGFGAHREGKNWVITHLASGRCIPTRVIETSGKIETRALALMYLSTIAGGFVSDRLKEAFRQAERGDS